MEYKYELHCHTGAVSLCGKVEPEKIVELYREKGYSGIVLTDHFSPMTFEKKHLFAPQKDYDFWLSAYHRLKDYCSDDFTVLLGMELRHWGTGNDYLIYGLEEDFLRRQGNLLMMGEKKVYKTFHDEGGCLIFQAHPYRWYITRCNPAYIDGIEIYNSYTPEKSNKKAEAWAKQTGKLVSSGSDFHKEDDVAKGGIVTSAPIKNNADLLAVLKSGNYKTISEGKIQP